MPRLLPVLVGVFLTAGLESVWSVDVENGRRLARKCSACHGKAGVSNDPEVPMIAGQHAFYLEKSLKDYRSGTRQDRRMTLMAQLLTDAEIQDLAAWFASMEVSAKVPQR